MPLQNRIDPWGVPHAVAARGAWMGNRGVLHDDERNVVRARGARQWIICQLEFKGRRRELMTPGAYTELFFLDEATALAAGHRPCFECRRPSATSFVEAWRSRAGRADDSLQDLDRQLSDERRVPRSGIRDGKRAHRALLSALPTGAVVDRGGEAWLVTDDHLHPWSFDGYGQPVARGDTPDEVAWVLTPESTVATIRAGYRPQMAVTAQ